MSVKSKTDETRPTELIGPDENCALSKDLGLKYPNKLTKSERLKMTMTPTNS